MTALSSFVIMVVCWLAIVSSQQTSQQPDVVVAPLRGALTLYDKACTRCHGVAGSFYGPDLGKNKTDVQLRKMVWEMCIAQGGLIVSKREIDAMTAYHRSIIRNEPYIEVLKSNEMMLTGEATLGSQVWAVSGKKTWPCTVQETAWFLQKPPVQITHIVVQLGKKRTQSSATLGSFSHDR